MKRSVLVTGISLLVILGIIGWAQHSPAPLPEGTLIDRVVVKKAAHALELYRGAELIRSYEVSLGRGSSGAKQREGDSRTPEGDYTLDYRKADSSFHRALHISYPLPKQEAAAKARGVSPGGLVMVHGIRNGLGFLGHLHTLVDWTNGCIAVTNLEIEEIWRVVPDGTPIIIEP
jgi:murein L,D-transpeptidase YafK